MQNSLSLEVSVPVVGIFGWRDESKADKVSGIDQFQSRLSGFLVGEQEFVEDTNSRLKFQSRLSGFLVGETAQNTVPNLAMRFSPGCRDFWLARRASLEHL